MPCWLEEKLGWLRDFRQEVGRYQRLLDCVEVASQEVKNHGLGQQTAQQVFRQLAPEALQDASLGDFRSGLRGYLQEEGGKVPQGQSWLGTSDVIESLFGKYKWFGEKAPYAEVGASSEKRPRLEGHYEWRFLSSRRAPTPARAPAAAWSLRSPR